MIDRIVLEGETSLLRQIDGEVTLVHDIDGDVGVFMPILPALQDNKTATPTEATQIITPDTQFNGLRKVTVEAIPSDYVGSAIVHDPTIEVDGPVVDIPKGYYTEDNTETVQTASQAVPSVSVNSSGLVTAQAVQGEGYVTGGTESAALQLSTQGATTITPTEAQQTAVSKGKYTTGVVKVGAIPSDYVGSGITRDPTPTASGATVNIPKGYYTANTSKAVQTVAQATPSISTNGATVTATVTQGEGYVSAGTKTASATVTAGTAGTPTATKGTVSNHSVTVTPSVTNTTGYITGGTITGTGVSVSASELVSGTLSVTDNGTADVTNYANVDVNVQGGGGAAKRGVIRGDAELVKTWSFDKMMTADLEIELPAYNSGSQTTLKATENLEVYEGNPSQYRYIVVQRSLVIPTYSIATLDKGREDHLYSSCAHEWIYQPANQIKTMDGSKTYGQYSQIVANTQTTRNVYWSSATAIAAYTSASYGLALTMTAPTIGSNKNLTIKTPALVVRGHATYFAQTFWEAVTDARLQWIIELWRVPIAQGVINGWTHTSQLDSIDNDVNNNGGNLR